MTRRRASLAAAALVLVSANGAFAQSAAPTFAQAIVIGSNQSVDRELPPLRYADDDAARFAELFSELGMKTFVLTRPDETTRRLHPEILADVRAPTERALQAVVEEATVQAAQARLRGETTVLYVVFAGHGNTRRGRAYLTLEDARFYAEDFLNGIVGAVAPSQAHLLIDACHSELFALSRGAGGTHRPLSGFLGKALGAGAENVGFVLSTSQSGESHEWEAFQSGVFSHEVRSGLVGAADVDGDGLVSYREIGAFVSRANAGIVNDRFRPTVLARAPHGTEVLLDLRPALRRHLRVDGRASGAHFLIEDVRGVRWADFHAGTEQPLKMLLPRGHAPFFVRRLKDRQESVIDGQSDVVILAEQPLRLSEVDTRGAAHHAFRTLFSLPFDREAAQSFELQLDEEDVPVVKATGVSGTSVRKYVGAAALAGAALAAAGGTYYFSAGHSLHNSTAAGIDQKETASRNQRIDRYDRNAAWLYGAAAVAGSAGLLLLLWPSTPVSVALAPEGNGATVQLMLRR